MQPSPTEQRNRLTVDIDQVDSAQVLKLIMDEDRIAVQAAASAIGALAPLVDLSVDRVGRGGRLHYFGAGASGRIALADATEATPTFGVPSGTISAHFPGGTAALVDPTLDLEDAATAGDQDAATVSGEDVVIGITASGGTAYVGAALAVARRVGALTVLITSNPAPPLRDVAEHLVVLDTGPEAITGSTRLKAGTATKVALNAFSSAVMIGLGRTYSNLMVSLHATNDKLHRRSVDLLVMAGELDPDDAAELLAACSGELPVAVVCARSGAGVGHARETLGRTGSIRAALAALASEER